MHEPLRSPTHRGARHGERGRRRKGERGGNMSLHRTIRAILCISSGIYARELHKISLLWAWVQCNYCGAPQVWCGDEMHPGGRCRRKRASGFCGVCQGTQVPDQITFLKLTIIIGLIRLFPRFMLWKNLQHFNYKKSCQGRVFFFQKKNLPLILDSLSTLAKYHYLWLFWFTFLFRFWFMILGTYHFYIIII